MLSEEQREVRRKFLKKSKAHYTEHRYLALMAIYDNEEIMLNGCLNGRIYQMALKDSAHVNRVVATELLNKYNILVDGKRVELSEHDRSPRKMERYLKCIKDTVAYFRNRERQVSEEQFIKQLKKIYTQAYCYFEYKFKPADKWIIEKLKELELYEAVIISPVNAVQDKNKI